MAEKLQRVPWLTLTLILVNLGVAVYTLFNPDAIIALAFDAHNPQVLAAFTSLFVHSNVIHLLGNLVFLAAVGPIIEFAKGSFKLSLIYLASGLLGIVGFWVYAIASKNTLPVVGASGAISGCVAFCAIRFLRTKVPIFVNVALPVGLLAGIWVLLQAIGAIIRIGDVGSADSGFWPHLGGFLGGLLMAALLGANTDAKKEFGHTVLDRMNDRGPSAALAAAKLHLERHPKDLKAWWQKIEAEIDLHELDAAANSLKELSSLLPDSETNRVIEKLSRIGKLNVFTATERLKIAERLVATEPRLAEDLYRSVARENEEPRRPEAILALIELINLEKPDESRTLAQTLLSQFELHPATESARAKGFLE